MTPRERREFGIYAWPGALGVFFGLLGWAMVWTFRDRLKKRT